MKKIFTFFLVSLFPLTVFASGGSGLGWFLFYLSYLFPSILFLVISYVLIAFLRRYIHVFIASGISAIIVYGGIYIIIKLALPVATLTPLFSEEMISIVGGFSLFFPLVYAIVFFLFNKNHRSISEFLKSSLFLANISMGIIPILSYLLSLFLQDFSQF